MAGPQLAVQVYILHRQLNVVSTMGNVRCLSYEWTSLVRSDLLLLTRRTETMTNRSFEKLVCESDEIDGHSGEVPFR